MSTKIYDAYRVPKNIDILKELEKIKEFSKESVALDGELLRMVHLYSHLEATKWARLDENIDIGEIRVKLNSSKYFLEQHLKGYLDIFWITDVLQSLKSSVSRDIFDLNFACSVFYDTDYWYVKFFVNDGWQRRVLSRMEAELNLFEDFHYQNQSDPPDDISYTEFKQRDSKWDELLGQLGTYRGGFQYTIFDEYDFKELLTENYYRGENDLYKHLAYEFDQKFDKSKHK
jgi:hypothetical protein